jgi:hypothetical protein
MMEAVSLSETSVNIYYITRRYIPKTAIFTFKIQFKDLYLSTFISLEPDSSVSRVSDYGLDDRAIKVRSPAEATDFSTSLCVQTGSGAHPASCTIDTGVPSPGVKSSRCVTLTAHPHVVQRSRMSKSYMSSPPKRLRGV